MSGTDKERTTIIDAKDLILGRMASLVAKRLLNGESIVIVNAEKAVISGKKLSVIQESKRFLEVGHFRKGPLHPRRPDNIVKKVIRGMLPRKKPHGIEALKRLRVYIGIPPEFENLEKETIEEVNVKKLRGTYVTVSEVARSIGWNG